MTLFLFPLLFRMLFLLRGQKISFSDYLRGIGQELFFAQILFSMGFLIQNWVFLLALPFQIYILLDAFLYEKIKTRLEPAQFNYFKELSVISSSLKTLSFYTFVGIVSALVIANTIFFFTSSDFVFSFWMLLPLGVSAWGFTKKLGPTNLHPFLLFINRRKSGEENFAKVSEEFFLKEKPHVIFVFMESFRAKDICEKYSPQFCELMKEGIYFPHFYANAVKTTRAAVASLQGIAPFLSQQGYTSAYLHNGSLSFENQRELFTYLGFQHLIGRNELLNIFPQALGNSWGIYDEYLMEYAADFLEKKRMQPTFMTLATMTNHHPWTPPPEGQNKKTVREQFLQTFTYSDATLGMFIRRLKEKNLYSESLIFILGDHGQPLGEHVDNPLPQSGLYEENVHIPLLILGNTGVLPKVCSSMGSQVDLLPTLKDLLGCSSSQSLLQDSSGRIAFFHSPVGKGFLGCRKENDKYILITSTQEEMLFDLEKDPHEHVNLAKQQPEKVKKYREAVKGYSFPSLPSHLSKDEKFTMHLGGSLKITDRELEKRIAKKKSLQMADLKDCLQLSDRGIRQLFKKCPHLEQVNLSGIHEVTDKAFASFKRKNRKMVNLEMVNCPKVTRAGVASLMEACPNLQRFSFSCANLLQFPDLACQQLHFLHLQQGYHLGGATFLSFLNAQPRLRHLIFEECPSLTDEILTLLHKESLKKITLLSCPEVTDRGLLAFKDSSLIFLEIYNCPKVTASCLQQLTKNGLYVLS